MLSLFALGGQVSAEDQNVLAAPAVINTDRPAFTNSSLVVPGSLQIENGFLETTTSGHQTYDYPETLLRFGVAEKTEIRLSVPDYYHNLFAGETAGSGWSDLALGIKEQLGPVRGFDVSLIVMLSVPTGSRFVSTHGYDPLLQLPWSHAIAKNWTAAGMLSLLWPTEGASRNTTGQATILLDRQLTNPWDAFIEYAGNYPERGGVAHIVHFGTAYKVTSREQVDFHVGFGVSSAAPDHLIGFGYSVLLMKHR